MLIQMIKDQSVSPRERHNLEHFEKMFVYGGGMTAEVELDVHYVPAYVRPGVIVPRGHIYQGNGRWKANWVPTLTSAL
jgi:hypothetical protein